MSSKVDFKELIELQKRLKKAQAEVPKMIEQIVDDIGNEFLAEVKTKTPNSDNNKLKNNWKKKVSKVGNGYQVEIYNDLEYASSVEYGHRINGGKGWKEGKFMMTITENDIQRRLDKIAQPHIDNMLKGMFK